jgi:calpain-15
VEVLIDDFVPVNEDGLPLFAKPHQNDIWVMLVEKAQAKVYGSYENMLASNSDPKIVLEKITFAPT